MSDLKSHKLIVLKGCLFLFMGCIAAALAIAEHPTVKLALLFGVAIWSFCRFYYFAFYVIEHRLASTRQLVIRPRSRNTHRDSQSNHHSRQSSAGHDRKTPKVGNQNRWERDAG